MVGSGSAPAPGPTNSWERSRSRSRKVTYGRGLCEWGLLAEQILVGVTRRVTPCSARGYSDPNVRIRTSTRGVARIRTGLQMAGVLAERSPNVRIRITPCTARGYSSVRRVTPCGARGYSDPNVRRVTRQMVITPSHDHVYPGLLAEHSASNPATCGPRWSPTSVQNALTRLNFGKTVRIRYLPYSTRP